MGDITRQTGSFGAKNVVSKGANYLNNLYRKIHDPLYRNAFLLTLSMLVASALGLFFWIIAAKLYSKEDVGVATALFSTGALLVTISRLGFDQTLTRFFPQGDKSKIFSSIIIVTTIITIIFAISLAFIVVPFLPSLELIRSNFIFFVVFVILLSYSIIASSAFVASRKAGSSLFLNVIMGSRLVFLFPLIAVGALGILGSLTAAYFITMLFSVVMLYRIGIRFRAIDWGFLRKSFWFSIGNYTSDVLNAIPVLILPAIVLQILGPTDAANYYIAYALASIMFIVPSAFSTSLFVEGSHGEDMSVNTKKALKVSFLVLIPAIIAIYIFAESLLGLIGKDYAAESKELLIALSFSAFFVSIYATFITNFKVRTEVKKMVILSAVNCVLLIVLSIALMAQYGVNGIGYAWIIGFALSVGAGLLLTNTHHLS